MVKGNDLVVKILHRGVNVGWGYDGGPIYFHYGANKPLSWMAKSIDDRTNATVTRRGILLTTLTNGPHGIKLYANDTEAQTASSMTYCFSIFNSPLKPTPTPNPTPTVPEFPATVTITMFIMTTLALTLVFRRKL